MLSLKFVSLFFNYIYKLQEFLSIYSKIESCKNK